MGIFLNVGKDVYERLTRVPHIADKTELINRLLEKTDEGYRLGGKEIYNPLSVHVLYYMHRQYILSEYVLA